MARISFNIPNDKVPILVDAFTERFGYQEVVPGENGELIPNPMSRQRFAKRKIADLVNNIVRDYQRSIAIRDLPTQDGAGFEEDDTTP